MSFSISYTWSDGKRYQIVSEHGNADTYAGNGAVSYLNAYGHQHASDSIPLYRICNTVHSYVLGIPNLMFGNTTIFFSGLVYQLAVFAICMFFALRLFKSDKIFTISLNFGQKSKFRKNSSRNANE